MHLRFTIQLLLLTIPESGVVSEYMEKIGAMVAAALLLPCALGSADAAGPLQEGPLHWTARHVKRAAMETGDTLSNVARTAGRTIHHRTRAVRQAFSNQ